MAQLVKIGSSQGVRIPKAFIEQAHLEGRELRLQVVEDGVLVTPVRKPREGWKEAIEASLKANGNEATDDEWLDADLASDDEWEWQCRRSHASKYGAFSSVQRKGARSERLDRV